MNDRRVESDKKDIKIVKVMVNRSKLMMRETKQQGQMGMELFPRSVRDKERQPRPELLLTLAWMMTFLPVSGCYCCLRSGQSAKWLQYIGKLSE